MTTPSTDKDIWEDDLRNLGKAKAFLMREFLLWLWYVIEEEQEGSYAFKSESLGANALIWIDDRLVLETVSEKANTCSLKGVGPAQSLEAYTSLAHGKRIKEMKLGLEYKKITPIKVILKSQNGAGVESIVIPKIDPDIQKDRDAMQLRIELMQEISQLMDELFVTFVELRISERWNAAETKKIQKWIKSKGKNSQNLLN